MAASDRASYFPAIEKKYGQPMQYWFHQLAELGDAKYPEQIAFLRENHGFSQTHANAVVMFVRGSTSAKRFTTIDQYLASVTPEQADTIRAIVAVLSKRYPKCEWVIAWNTPMLRTNGSYVFGISAAKNHLLIAPWGNVALAQLAPKLTVYTVNKKTIQIPNDWKVDAVLLQALVDARLGEIGEHGEHGEHGEIGEHGEHGG